jgi:hypothetical protein
VAAHYGLTVAKLTSASREQKVKVSVIYPGMADTEMLRSSG